MRRFLGLTLLLLAVTVPLALAAGTPTDGTLSIKRGRGTVALKVTGTIIAHVNNGRIQVRDFRPYDANVPQWSCKRHRISRQVSYCNGRNLGVRVEDGRFTVNVRGNGISISAVAHGQVDVDGAGDTGVSDGVMSIDDAPYQSLPDFLTTFYLGPPPPGS
ncbi:MAG TPA: hypothetical protein VHU60_09480 [Gaiellaceae bacterium]|jgi:hypothetical protein|nr:hypothetical protein [Gaiellaceae bacterium]